MAIEGDDRDSEGGLAPEPTFVCVYIVGGLLVGCCAFTLIVLALLK